MAAMHHLPEDIVFNIFSQIPTKPLLRLRCVSKDWNRMILDHITKSRSRRMILLPFKPLQAIDNMVPSCVMSSALKRVHGAENLGGEYWRLVEITSHGICGEFDLAI
ncbi:hypothetical protein L1987_75469 [Smallanthus sonchifolius]|uniref:Uncharacterized protein n=1 Tax=Smallanthus sonchifolius TaxID=185202 RepID=A0ACB9A9Y0_9ASTR|nr:hypothetical protein L1987_75469 [Smallanthus sonchifolius]